MRGMRSAIEWPTALLAAAIYGGWAALTYFHGELPAIAVAALGTWLVAWHSSLQHEILHGHPTRWPAVNAALGVPPLSLWLPYERYRATHLQHHHDERLTDPLDDPESKYLTPEQWARLGAIGRVVVRANGSFLGRLVLGPALAIGRFLADEARACLAGNRGILRTWSWHLAGVLAVAYWIVGVCGMGLWFYALAIAYPATSLILIRSFAEHRAAERVRERTAVVEKAPLLGPLFLFNNLHAAHHECPALSWYALPGYYRANRTRLLAENGGHFYRSYVEIARRFLFVPHDTPVHPTGRVPVLASANK
jgi:fatty acid desaturase